jgi:hypothetical protein
MIHTLEIIIQAQSALKKSRQKNSQILSSTLRNHLLILLAHLILWTVVKEWSYSHFLKLLLLNAGVGGVYLFISSTQNSMDLDVYYI